MNTPSNEAAWLVTARAPLEVKAAPYTRPGDHEIVVRNRALAINPVDWLKQSMGDLMFSWIRMPFVLGSDLAGDVVEVGAAVTRFRVGDRVLGHAVGMDPKRNRASEGAFQTTTVLLENLASAIPDALSYERAAVLPLGLSTAACGLFQKDQLALAHPSARSAPTGKTLLIWGGATSVGSNAIQLAVAAGYEVFTTCSAKNVDYVRRLGATRAFDYRSATVVSELVDALKGKPFAGALAIGTGSGAKCLDVVRACEGQKFVAMASTPVAFDALPEGRGRRWAIAKVMLAMVWAFSTMWVKSKLSGIRTNFIFGSSLFANEVGPMIYADFLPDALREGRYVAAPDPEVTGTGLGAVQGALDAQRRGMSAKKVVVTL